MMPSYYGFSGKIFENTKFLLLLSEVWSATNRQKLIFSETGKYTPVKQEKDLVALRRSDRIFR